MNSAGVGEVVLYILSLNDVVEINTRRADISHIDYNPVMNGDGVPAIVTRSNVDGSVNLRLMLDGLDDKWMQFRRYSESGEQGFYTNLPGWKVL